MPKQIFQRPAPVRHDHWNKTSPAGPPTRPGGKNGRKKPVVLMDRTDPSPLPDRHPGPERRK